MDANPTAHRDGRRPLLFLTGAGPARGTKHRDTSAEVLSILAAKEAIERDLAVPLYVSHFASVAGLHPATFTRRFARYIGVTPIRYRLELRVARARELLVSAPNEKIAAIAAAVGFEDVRFFYRAFRSVAGATPVAYRRRHLEDARRAVDLAAG
jgi:transcriptional regulator GlxA family with amidase domain